MKLVTGSAYTILSRAAVMAMGTPSPIPLPKLLRRSAALLVVIPAPVAALTPSVRVQYLYLDRQDVLNHICRQLHGLQR